jgi:photosystem I subunit 10
MLVANALAIAFAKYTVKYPNVGPKLIDDFSVPALIGAACFGHVLGAGAILGLSNLGVL